MFIIVNWSIHHHSSCLKSALFGCLIQLIQSFRIIPCASSSRMTISKTSNLVNIKINHGETKKTFFFKKKKHTISNLGFTFLFHGFNLQKNNLKPWWNPTGSHLESQKANGDERETHQDAACSGSLSEKKKNNVKEMRV